MLEVYRRGLSRDRVDSIATTVLVVPAVSSRCLCLEAKSNTIWRYRAGLHGLPQHPLSVPSFQMDVEKKRKKRRSCSAHHKQTYLGGAGGGSLAVLKVLMCGLDAGTPCLPWQQLHPGSLPPHRHVSCQSNPQQQQQHRIAQAPLWGAALAWFAPSAVDLLL